MQSSPAKIELVGNTLALVWSDGKEHFFNSSFLREQSPSAEQAGEADIFGVSLVPLLKGEKQEDWRKSLYYHYHEGGGHGVARHEGVNTERHKLIHFFDKKEWELFDLKNDPDERKSVYGNPEYAKVQAKLLKELERLKKEYEVPAIVYKSHKEIQAEKKKGR